MIGVPAHQQPAQQDRGDKLDRHHARRRLVRGTSDPENEQTEAARSQQRAGKIECVHGARRVRQGLQADGNGNHAEGNVDREQPRPRPYRQNAGGDRWPQCEGGRDHQRVMAKSAAEKPARIDETNKRRVHAHDAAGAQPLQRPRRQQAR